MGDQEASLLGNRLHEEEAPRFLAHCPVLAEIPPGQASEALAGRACRLTYGFHTFGFHFYNSIVQLQMGLL